MSPRPVSKARVSRSLLSKARSAGGYFTDGVRLLHVRVFTQGGSPAAIVEDCRTLALFYASIAELDRMCLHPVMTDAVA
jgi:hypothetical protein